MIRDLHPHGIDLSIDHLRQQEGNVAVGISSATELRTGRHLLWGPHCAGNEGGLDSARDHAA